MLTPPEYSPLAPADLATELHEDRTPPAGPYPAAPPAGGASVHTETPAEPYQAPEPPRPA